MYLRQKAARLVASTSHNKPQLSTWLYLRAKRSASTVASDSEKSEAKSPATSRGTTDDQQPKKKTQAELDKELQLKMQGLAGDGGEMGVEYEDGKPVSMKRSVRENMFRYI